MRMKLFLTCLLSLLIPEMANCQHIILVKQLAPRSEWTSLMQSITLDGKLYFTTESTGATVLWVTDGRFAGTVKVYEWARPIGPLSVFNNKLFFAAYDHLHGEELWSSDGTPGGTAMVMDIWPGSGSGYYHNRPGAKELNGKMYFFGTDTITVPTIWESDGTAANTKQVVHLLPAGNSEIISADLEVANGRLYFNGFVYGSPVGLWSSDGTIAGTGLVKPDLQCDSYIPLGNKLLFTARHKAPRLGVVLGIGSSDGTEYGTSVLSPNLYTSEDHVDYHGRMVFLNGPKMFATDGTVAGTELITESLDWQDNPLLLTPSQKLGFPVVHKDLIYFCGKTALWASNATQGGTFMVKELAQDTLAVIGTFPTGLTSCGGQMFFKAFEHGRVEIFMSDGTASGTYRVDRPGANYRYAGDPAEWYLHPQHILEEPLMVLNNELYFMAVYDSALGKALYKIQLPSADVQATSSRSSLFSLSPNPTSGSVQIGYPGNAYSKVQVLDLSGREVGSQSLSASGQDELNLTQLPTGSYLVRLSGSGSPISAPVVLAR